MTNKEKFAPSIVLTLICVVAAALLSLTYQVTKPQIELINAENAAKARMEVLEAADGFTEMTDVALVDGVLEVYQATNGAGYVVTSSSKGFGGAITVMTGFDTEGNITKVKVTDASNETPGLGSKTTLPSYTDQYSGAAAITNDKADTSATYIQAVTGASYSSRGVYNCVTAALMQLQEIGGGF